MSLSYFGIGASLQLDDDFLAEFAAAAKQYPGR
jgi:hypothetical protein